mmetsp:Transcript_6645/g.9483  ORF Transcript_6645/g.9483 Transcript_6645/m.9483 type:complete len:89 (-) Transcript_6645:15-281(-)
MGVLSTILDKAAEDSFERPFARLVARSASAPMQGALLEAASLSDSRAAGGRNSSKSYIFTPLLVRADSLGVHASRLMLEIRQPHMSVR